MNVCLTGLCKLFDEMLLSQNSSVPIHQCQVAAKGIEEATFSLQVALAASWLQDRNLGRCYNFFTKQKEGIKPFARLN